MWGAIDALAASEGTSASGLARRAGLDPTAFNPSKRFGSDGRPRWPSTESIAKILAATGTSLPRFVGLQDAPMAPLQPADARFLQPLPLLGLAQAGAGGFFDDGGFPAGQGWDEVPLPGLSDEGAYALKVTGESMQPVYRDGDIIIVSPTATIHQGDRVVVKTRDGEVMAKMLKRRTTKLVEVASLNPEHGDRILPLADIDWVARIVWASQ